MIERSDSGQASDTTRMPQSNGIEGNQIRRSPDDWRLFSTKSIIIPHSDYLKLTTVSLNKIRSKSTEVKPTEYLQSVKLLLISLEMC